jgi:hypothetical protein
LEGTGYGGPTIRSFYALYTTVTAALDRTLIELRALAATRWVEKIRLHNWTVLELGQPKTSLFSGQNTQLLDPADRAELPAADLVVFLGLAEKLKREEFQHLLLRITARRILFSYEEKKRRRGEHYTSEEMRDLLAEHGFRQCEVRSLPWRSPTKLVLAQRGRYAPPPPLGR